MTDFALCRTCPEITTGRVDSSKGWQLHSSSNHHHCDVAAFGDLPNLPMPIRNTILRLGAGAPLTNADITMFKLGLILENQWSPPPSTVQVAANTSQTPTAPVTASAASMKLPRAFTPTSNTAAPVDQMVLDFGEPA